MFQYKAFGLGIESNFQIPEFHESDGEVDLTFHLDGETESPILESQEKRTIYAAGDEIVATWSAVGTFFISSGRIITVHSARHADTRLVRLYLLGAPLAFLLQQRGYTVMHGSAVSIRGQCVLFVGEKGMGKSTIAAALYARGHRLLSDDVAVIRNSEGFPEVLGGFPQFKLWPDTVESAFQSDAEKYPRLAPHFEKRAVRADESFCEHPVTLRRVYLIAGGQTPAIEDISSREALLGLLPHWYGARFGQKLLNHFGQANNLLQCGNIVNKVPVSLLRRQRSLETLPDLVRLVEEQMEMDLELLPTVT